MTVKRATSRVTHSSSPQRDIENGAWNQGLEVILDIDPIQYEKRRLWVSRWHRKPRSIGTRCAATSTIAEFTISSQRAVCSVDTGTARSDVRLTTDLNRNAGRVPQGTGQILIYQVGHGARVRGGGASAGRRDPTPGYGSRGSFYGVEGAGSRSSRQIDHD